MPQTMYWKVSIIESERGWGQRTDSTHYFRKVEEAKSFVGDYNKKNTKANVPDWYMYASEPQSVHIDSELAKLILEDFKTSAVTLLGRD